MEQENVTYFLALYGRYYPQEKMPEIIEKLKALPDGSFEKLNASPKKDPLSVLTDSLFLGYFGIDRMMIGQTGKGLLKLFIVAVMCVLVYFGIWEMDIPEINKMMLSAVALLIAGVWPFIDWFRIESLVKQHNYGKIKELFETLEQTD